MRISPQEPRRARESSVGGSSRRVAFPALLAFLAAGAMAGPGVRAQEENPSPRMEDRGGSIPTSLFGTYLSAGELLLYPFYEYTTNRDAEYNPEELGFTVSEDFLGKEIENEALIFIGYGFSDRLALEFEAAVWASSELRKAPDDPSNQPETIKESGLGDVETQLRWVWAPETAQRPMFYSFWELVFPFQKNKLILGTQDWETALGFGVVRGYRWGTLNGRVTAKYDAEDGQVEPGEFGLEYLKRTSPRWRWVAALEGEDDEISLIGEAQLTVARRAVLKLNLGVGLTGKAPDFAPEVGIIFSF